ncbi:hypothetical protein RHGRI_034231 [Rhododendron griersonianum]|uniref:Maturase K n=1 Tax=Rhododendron griersonianum TaxID=479676 RepID=A0AAV6I497_9ERIC|nr:hypothetical protein RHGRI_034231 [Rhododendron griersonianum]
MEIVNQTLRWRILFFGFYPRMENAYQWLAVHGIKSEPPRFKQNILLDELGGESHQPLFVECTLFNLVWKSVLSKNGITRTPMGLLWNIAKELVLKLSGCYVSSTGESKKGDSASLLHKIL